MIAAAPSRHAARSFPLKQYVLYALAALVAVLAVLPFYWLISTSLKPGNQVATNPPILFPTTFTLQNYVDVFRSEDIARFALNSVVIATTSTLLTVFMDADGTQSSVPWNIGEDHDRFVRTEEGWRIASRRYVNLFTRGDSIDIP